MKVCELYSGIGGMHFALRESGINAEVSKAVDINTSANAVYRLNFSEKILLEKNIESLTENDFNSFNVDMILMSPPCQPHTRNGLKKDKLDQRSNSLLHILTLIPKMHTVKYILLENVKGFEESQTRDDLIKVLNESNYSYQEFLLTPSQFHIPNSRLRYYLLAKKKPLEFCFQIQNTVMKELPPLKEDVDCKVFDLNKKYKILSSNNSCFQINLIIDSSNSNLIPEKILRKYGTLFDIVTSQSTKSCCFTKGYGHFVEGTGSVLSPKDTEFISEVFKEKELYTKESEKALELLKSLNLRYFTPKEISRLMCFPENFKFPLFLTDKQKYRLLGNSINVHVVALLIVILVN